MLRFFRTPALSAAANANLVFSTQKRMNLDLQGVRTEYNYYVQTSGPLSGPEMQKLSWLLGETFEPENLATSTFLNNLPKQLEVGPRLNFETAWSTTATAVCHACGISKITRLEQSIRYGLPINISDVDADRFLAPIHDRMTQVRYTRPLRTLISRKNPKPVQIIDLLGRGSSVLRDFSQRYGCGWDEFDINWINDLFRNFLKSNPTDVTLFQIAQSLTAEHSRHGFWKGKHYIDGVEQPESLMDVVKTPWKANPGNSRIAFGDDSSSMRGMWIDILIPLIPGQPGPLIRVRRLYNPTLTAESHNHPTLIEPFEGAGTGGGGRLRDNQCVGRGGLVIAGGPGYCVGNLSIPGYVLPWEDEDGWSNPFGFASPLEILIKGSNGASNYGNCFGEAQIFGFTRSFGQTTPEGRRSFYKPVLYTVGAGQMEDQHTKKKWPKKDMYVVQIGGKAFRIGLGGGSASSSASGAISSELAFQSVQRGGPEMGNRVYRVFEACIARGRKNPIKSAHDYGAGGAGNTLFEISEPSGARIRIRELPVGDDSLSVLELESNESQERNAVLIEPEDWEWFKAVCDRERVDAVIAGVITGDGWYTVVDDNDGSVPVRLPLDRVLQNLPRRTFHHQHIPIQTKPLVLPKNLTVRDALDRVLRLVSVGSKRFLTNKVDRSVSGLIAQQQCVGPNQLPLSDYAVIAQTMLNFWKGTPGVALSLGEQPNKGLLNPAAMARLATSEALLNMCGALITSLEDIKLEANWMWAAKLPGEGARLHDAAYSLVDILLALGIAIDGGKDSLSMSAKMKGPDEQTHDVKAPGELILSFYATMDDVATKVTCDAKRPGNSLLFIDLAAGKNRLGGSALAQVYEQLGDECPDVEDILYLKQVFLGIQGLLRETGLLASVHDRSDGGLITCLLEMAFAGNTGLDINFSSQSGTLSACFAEEPGLVLETAYPIKTANFLSRFGVRVDHIGKVVEVTHGISVRHNDNLVLSESMPALRRVWESTSTELDKLQANPACVMQEAEVNFNLVTSPPYHLTFEPVNTTMNQLRKSSRPQVAVIREQGTNGDREMRAALYAAGFRVYDVTMSDLVEGRETLDRFRGIIFPGGFSFGDVLDSAKGWAGVIRFNKRVRLQFEQFFARADTFSLGVCNGCQLMALMGWVPGFDLPDTEQPRFTHNVSGRFESRWVTVKILPSPALMLKDMAGSTLGVWQAHGEGYLKVPKPETFRRILERGLAPIRFVNTKNQATMVYPFNPNGSPYGVTALCSENGRHLALMPHPERCFRLWQLPWMPKEWGSLITSPWLKLFQNAREWCDHTRHLAA